MTTGRINQVTIICRNARIDWDKNVFLIEHIGLPSSSWKPKGTTSVFIDFSLSLTHSCYFGAWKVNQKSTTIYSFSVQAHYLYRHRKPSWTHHWYFYQCFIQLLFLWRTCTLPPILVQAKLSIRCNVVLPCGLLTQNGWCSPLPRTPETFKGLDTEVQPDPNRLRPPTCRANQVCSLCFTAAGIPYRFLPPSTARTPRLQGASAY
jgi:hypothetical protein